jgi:putative spermidine/putrescine transport system ATP-binding protein
MRVALKRELGGGAAGADGVIARLRGVRKSFDGETLVVRDVDLDIDRGEFLTLLGPSGSGKTTLLMMLAGFEAPTAGEIESAGRSVRDIPPHRRDIGMVFQSYALFPHMTVAENVGFPLEVRGRRRGEIRERVAHALELVRLAGFAGRHPGQLSGGQQQRVALARALVFEPKLVLMDEPLGALDKQLREQMQLEIRHIHERLGVSFVAVTHDQTEALTMSDRVAVFNDGRIQQLDTPERVYEAPANTFVAHFIGENNRLPGRIVEARDGACVVELLNGEILTAVPGLPLEAGSLTTISLRPERLRLGAAAASYPNRFEAEIRELIYIGDHTRARLAVFGNEAVVARISPLAATAALRVGERVTIGFPPEDARALDRED